MGKAIRIVGIGFLLLLMGVGGFAFLMFAVGAFNGAVHVTNVSVCPRGTIVSMRQEAARLDPWGSPDPHTLTYVLVPDEEAVSGYVVFAKRKDGSLEHLRGLRAQEVRRGASVWLAQQEAEAVLESHEN